MKRTHSKKGFTLVEIMIVVAIIALLAAIAVPNFLRARKRSQATRVLEDLRNIDSAIDLYAIENNKGTGAAFGWQDLTAYVKKGGALYNTLGTGAARDLLGNFYFSTGLVDTGKTITVATATYNTLSDVAPSDFWSPYNP